MAKKEKKEKVTLGGGTSVEISSLYAIQQKEIEINTNILHTKREAEEIVAKARLKAVGIREKAEKDGADQAKAVNKKEVAKATKKAGKIRSFAGAECEKARAQGKKGVPKAVAYVTDAIIGKRT